MLLDTFLQSGRGTTCKNPCPLTSTSSDIFVLKIILVFIFISFQSSYFSFYLVFVLQIISVLVLV
jgi:hypothetical protein